MSKEVIHYLNSDHSSAYDQILRNAIACRIQHLRMISRDIDDENYDLMSKYKNLSRDEWIKIDKGGVEEFRSILDYYHDKVKEIGHSDPKEENLNELIKKRLNPNENFGDHIIIMNTYSQKLEDAGFFENTGISKEFFDVLIEMHDAGRRIFNGLSIYKSDVLSHNLEQMLFQYFPKEYLHQVEWLIGAGDPLPDSLNDFSQAQNVAVTLKIIDSIGKFASVDFDNRCNSELRSYKEMYAPGGSFDEWITSNTHRGTFPFKVNGRDVSADEYRVNELKVCQLGATVIEMYSGYTIEDLTQSVAAELNVKVKYLRN